MTHGTLITGATFSPKGSLSEVKKWFEFNKVSIDPNM